MAILTSTGISKVFNERLFNKVDKTWWHQTSIDDNSAAVRANQVLIRDVLGKASHRTVDNETTTLATGTIATVAWKPYPLLIAHFEPIIEQMADKAENLYDTATAIMKNMEGDIFKYLSERAMYNWTPETAANIIETNGSARTNKFGTAVKEMTYDNFLAAKQILMEQEYEDDEIYFKCNTRFYNDIKKMDAFDNSDLLKTKILTDGYVGMLDGVKIIVSESNNVFATGGAALQPFEQTPVSGDLAYGIMYHKTAVRKCVPQYTRTNIDAGMVSKFIVTEPSGSGGGKAFEAIVRNGFTISRIETGNVNFGVVAIVEGV